MHHKARLYALCHDDVMLMHRICDLDLSQVVGSTFQSHLSVRFAKGFTLSRGLPVVNRQLASTSDYDTLSLPSRLRANVHQVCRG